MHGFNVDHGEAVKFRDSVASIADGATDTAITVGYSWPAEGKVTHYIDDRAEARASGEAFAVLVMQARRALEDERCNARMVLIAHSMGSYVLARASRYAAESLGWPTSFPIFSEIILLAPDLDSEALEQGRGGEWLPVFARRLTVYFSRNDGVLAASSAKRAGLTGGRLGRQGPANLDRVSANVVAVDSTKLAAGHSSYFKEARIHHDIQQVIDGKDRREVDGRVETDGVFVIG